MIKKSKKVRSRSPASKSSRTKKRAPSRSPMPTTKQSKRERSLSPVSKSNKKTKQETTVVARREQISRELTEHENHPEEEIFYPYRYSCTWCMCFFWMFYLFSESTSGASVGRTVVVPDRSFILIYSFEIMRAAIGRAGARSMCAQSVTQSMAREPALW